MKIESKDQAPTAQRLAARRSPLAAAGLDHGSDLGHASGLNHG
jgi:hypothetical protein